MAGDQAYLNELRGLWQRDFVASILTARLNHTRIPPEAAAIAQGMDRAFHADKSINDAVEHQMGLLGISGGGGGGLGASSAVDPDEFMFYSAMGMISAHRGNPPAAPALRAQARQIVTGELDPLSALELSAPSGLAGTGLMGGVLALAGDMAPLIRKMGLFMAALAVPPDEIQPLLSAAIGQRLATQSNGAARGVLGGSYTAGPRTSMLAIVSAVLGLISFFMLSLLASIPAVVVGHKARREIGDANGTVGGGGLAMFGLIAGYANIVLSILFFIYMMVLMGSM